MRRPGPGLHSRVLQGLRDVSESDWAQLNPEGSPFVSHAYLSQLEERGLVGNSTGWVPCHLIADEGGAPTAALPFYEKRDSYGEFVFDWAWAEAYHRLGRPYYPKLVCAVPFTPVPGHRVLTANNEDRVRSVPVLMDSARTLMRTRQASSLHLLFPLSSDAELLAQSGFESRFDCRFLWRNPGYATFDEFLEIFSARQRKNIRRERRRVREAGVDFEWITGPRLADVDWTLVHEICAGTFRRRGHNPYLDAGFFEAMAEHMPDQLLVLRARKAGEICACAIYFRDNEALYGRYWGAVEAINSLHFEACYYQGIEYAIEQGLRRFDPGTQGEHKLRRGFAPVVSRSLHFFEDRQIGEAIARWLRQERGLVKDFIRDCRSQMPFKEPDEMSDPMS